MAASHAPMLKTGGSQSAAPHLLLAEELCPTCEQVIPHDHHDEIKERIEMRQRERSAAITAQLQELHSREKTQWVEKARQDSEAMIAAARNEERQAAETLLAERIAVAERASQETQAALRLKLEEAEAAKSDAETKIEKVKEEAAEREKSIRAEATSAAEATMLEKLADSERRRTEIEASLNEQIEVATAASTALQDRLTQQQQSHAIKIEEMTAASATQADEIRQQANAAAAANVQDKIAELEQAKTDAETKTALAQQQTQTLQKTHETLLQEQREALEKARDDAVNAEKSAAFEDRLKLQTKFDDLKRAYEQKTNEELGEGAEVDLYEDLKREFEGDKIDRVNRGQPGADILHVVMYNGQECGRIIYDSKNHAAWRNDFVAKLARDQLGAKAEHAILSTRAFPAKARHLHVQDGVILANPARVVTIVEIVRQHLIQTHKLRLSSEQRTQKTAALYDFITSERYAGILARIDTHTEDLLDLQVKEKKAHDTGWKRQGELIRAVQRVRGELTSEVETIVGTAEMKPENTR